MQSTIMQLKHKLQTKKLKTFSKSTMTDVTLEDSTVSTRDTSSFTDSATQVDLIVSPAKHPPELKDTPTSLKWKPPATLSSSRGQESSRDRSSRHIRHHRAHSDGEILLHKRRAKAALEKMQDLSRTFQQASPVKTREEKATTSTTANGSLEANTRAKSGGLSETLKQEGPAQPGTTGASSKLSHPPDSATKEFTERGSVPKKKHQNVSAAPHKCVWQQQVKSLQQRLKTLTKQVCDYSYYTVSPNISL